MYKLRGRFLKRGIFILSDRPFTEWEGEMITFEVEVMPGSTVVP